MFTGRDPERQAATDEAFRRAVAGDANALLFLKQRTGDYGVIDVPGYGATGGWASPNAKEYARQKYAEAVRQLALMGQVTKVEQGIATAAKGAAQDAGYQIVPQWMIWAALAVVVGIVVMSNKRGA
jgi:hypothetical protein